MSAAQPSPRTVESRGPLTGVVTVPGDKSISHRAVMFSALAVGESRIEGLLEGEDVLRSAAAMRAFGATVERLGEGRKRVEGKGGFEEPADVIDCGNAGTGMRLLAGLLATALGAGWTLALEGVLLLGFVLFLLSRRRALRQAIDRHDPTAH